MCSCSWLTAVKEAALSDWPAQPDRAGVRNTVFQPQSQEPHKRQPVIDEKFGAFIGKIVSRLDDKDLEHQHRVEGWPPAFRPIRVAERRI